jgi:hypothetical protein
LLLAIICLFFHPSSASRFVLKKVYATAGKPNAIDNYGHSQAESQRDLRFPGAAVAPQLSRRARNSHRASSSTRVLFSVGMAKKSKLSIQILTDALHFLTAPSASAPYPACRNNLFPVSNGFHGSAIRTDKS